MLRRGSSTSILITIITITLLSTTASSAFIRQQHFQFFCRAYRTSQPTATTEKQMMSSSTVDLPRAVHSLGDGISVIPIPFDSSHLQDHGIVASGMMSLAEWTMWLSDSSVDQELPLFVIIPIVFLMGSISAFIYANQVYTPEIVENAERIRQEIREEEIQKLFDVVQQHMLQGKDLEELRRPLEFALDMAIEDYIASVVAESTENSLSKNDMGRDSPPYRSTISADAKLAALLASSVLGTD